MPFAIGVSVIAFCALMPKLWKWFIGFHMTNFAEIYFSVFLMILGFILFRLIKVKKNYKSLIKTISKIKSLTNNWNGGVLVGYAHSVPVSLPDHLRLEHVQIVGATGRGKTKSVIIPWIRQDFLSGKKIILIDGKGDLSLKDELFLGENYKNEKVVHFNMDDIMTPSTTNPLKFGTPQQITDRIFSSFDFKDEFYRGLQYETCLKMVRLLKEVENEVTLKDINQCLVDDDFLAEKIKKSKNIELTKDFSRLINQPRKDRTENHMGLTTQIGPFATGELSELVNGKVDDKSLMSLSELLLKTPDYQMILISLPTLSYQSAGKALGKMLLQELAWAIGEREQSGSKEFVSVFLDEFSSFAYSEFIQVLNKARSSKVALHISHQSMGDLWSISKEFGDIVNTNTNVKILLGLNDPEAADYFSRHIGTRTIEKLTERAQDKGFFFRRIEKSGDLSLREVEQYIIHPNELKSLSPGEGVIFTRTPEGPLATHVDFPRL